ncbi:MAG TPA: glycosyltransferase family 39 protein, partial [Thermoanaerobaculia bacterium]|nr:glycosyltransferase family 39 protein [Thermoanaerobaculia bacterium]
MQFLKVWWREVAGALVVLASRLLTMPRTLWELDEFHFAFGVRAFEPLKMHPHPPGYPLFVALGKVADLIAGDPFRALVAVSVIACVIGFVALSLAFRRMIGNADIAAAAAMLFYFSAGMLVHATLALADSASLAFLALTFWLAAYFPEQGTNRRAVALAFWASAAIGCRPQIAVPLLPALLVMLVVLVKDRRQRVLAVATFAVVSAFWFFPLMEATGGPGGLYDYEARQAAYVAAHDAAESRGTMNGAQIAVRFLLHPWGSKYVTIPLLACLAIGMIPFARACNRKLWPLVVFSAVHIAFAMLVMDPADGVRYSLPSMALLALIAAMGLGRVAQWTELPATWIGVAFFAAVSLWYTRPIIAERTSKPSPVVAASAYANAKLSPGTVVLYAA